ncbi:glycine betaine ABC transporter substrate-binding protein [Blautia liquoris]|uniref:Glycine betaine ABC transporter substrate-binding protein n=1 Tax=Blautia liquoris TaxID=2779518 RepID=A0A7M2RFR1_9FIRM|nr:glycine betaine ABC transporter substrate-binding protein [Blautia liquoris]QOV19175.1 glycine betaine ABC transporter substrate-binding protein [Blautia liquoris]
MEKRVLAAVLSLVILMTGLTGCGKKKEEGKTVNLAYVDWSDSVAITNLAAAVLEEKMGYDVDIKMADIAPIFTSVASGNTDAYLDTWLPVTHKSYIEKYGDDMVDLGPVFEDALLGFVVPTYVDIDSIEDLKDQQELFDGKIIGIDAGAGLMLAAEDALKDYKLDYKLINGSAASMTAALGKAIKEQKPIVVTGWTPHWMFHKWDLKVLEDPKESFGEKETAYKYVRKGLAEDMPEVNAFFKKFYLKNEDLNNLIEAIEADESDPLSVSKEWMKEHEELINSWLK